MFHIKPYDDHGARVGAIEGAASAIPVFAIGALGGIFGGTLWGKTGFGIGALAGSIFGFFATKVAKASQIEEGAIALEQSEMLPDDAVVKDKQKFDATDAADQEEGFARFGTKDTNLLKIDLMPQVVLGKDEQIALTKPFNWKTTWYKSDRPYATKISDGQRVTFFYIADNSASNPTRANLEGFFVGNGEGSDEPGNRVIVDRLASGDYPLFKKGVYNIPASVKHFDDDEVKKLDPRKFYDRISPVEWKIVDPKTVGLEAFPFPVPVEEGQRVTIVLRDAFGTTVVAFAKALGSPEYGIFDAVPQSVHKIIKDFGQEPITFDDTPVMVYTKNYIVDPKSLK